MDKKISLRDMLQRIIWALVGYFASIYGVVDLPVPGVLY
jgi:hypothetical protein